MSPEEIVRLIFSLLGGGIVAGLLNLWNTNRVERKRKRSEFIRLQLQELYGPLQFWTSCNAQLFRLVEGFHGAYQAEYIDQKWSQEDLTQERLREWTSQTLNISNQYVSQVVENNVRILEILTNHYSLIEPTDAEILAQFILDYTRSKTELGEAGLKTPIQIYNRVGHVSFMRPEFIAAVDKRFKEKKAELEKLLK